MASKDFIIAELRKQRDGALSALHDLQINNAELRAIVSDLAEQLKRPPMSGFEEKPDA